MSITSGVSRRERVRAATLEEIKATARRLLVERGPHNVTLRAIAREMGMTAPGLYRYVPSHEDLVTLLVADLYDELTAWLVRAAGEVGTDSAAARLTVLVRAFRGWAVQHPAEFGLIFGSPMPQAVDESNPKHAAGMRFGAVFITAFFGLWRERPFPVPADDELPEGLARQFIAYRESLAEQIGPEVTQIPLGAFNAFLECWAQLYGVVALEAFNHLHFCLDDVTPFFEVFTARMAAAIGIDQPLPAPPGDAAQT